MALGASDSGGTTFTATAAGSFAIVPIISGGSNAALGTPAALGTTTTAGIAVFSGSGTWTGSSGTLWSTAGNWTDANGTQAPPGTFAGFGSSDTALFSGAGTATAISLAGANPSLNALSLSGTNHLLAGGTLTFSGGSGTATVSLSGSQTIASAATLATSVGVAPQAGSTLAISGIVGGSGGLVLNGPGTLLLSGSNSYTGGTAVLDGKLIAAESYSLADGSSLTVGDASLFAPVFPDLAANSLAGSSVPEPGTLALLAAAAALMALYRRRR